MRIRTANACDAAAILAVYTHYVENTAISFEYEVPTLKEFEGRIATTLEKYPYLVAEQNGAIVGYAYAGPFNHRPAYSHSCEVTIYIRHDSKRKGLGRALYEELEKRLAEIGILNLYACVADPIEEDEYLTRDSERFHSHLGFKRVGKFHKCGFKFGNWYNMIWMEKIIGKHE